MGYVDQGLCIERDGPIEKKQNIEFRETEREGEGVLLFENGDYDKN